MVFLCRTPKYWDRLSLHFVRLHVDCELVISDFRAYHYHWYFTWSVCGQPHYVSFFFYPAAQFTLVSIRARALFLTYLFLFHVFELATGPHLGEQRCTVNFDFTGKSSTFAMVAFIVAL